MDRPIIPRREQRKAVDMAARCRTSSGLRDRGFITDLSSHGCCVATKGLFVKVGARVMIRPEAIEGLTGVVRWIDGMRAGIEFDTPIYGPVFDHLSALHAAGEQVPMSEY